MASLKIGQWGRSKMTRPKERRSMENKLENIEAIMCLMMITIANIVLTSSRILIKSTGSASLLNAIYISLVAIILTVILCLLSKQFIGKGLLDISEFLGKKPLKIIISFSYVAYFLLQIGLFLKKMADALQIIYYPLTHIVFIIALFCIACGIIASLGNNSLFKTMVLLVPFLYLAVILIFMGNSKNFTFRNIYPLLGNGVQATFLGGLSNIFSFTGLIYLLFLPPKLKHPEKITKIGLIFITFAGIYLLFCIASIIFLFGNVLNHADLPPLYLSVRYIEFGTFFQRLDAAFIFICVLGFICALNINLFFTLDILKQTLNLSSNKPLIAPCLLASLAIALSIKKNSTLDFLEDNASKILYIIFAIAIPLLILIAGIIKKKVTGGDYEKST